MDILAYKKDEAETVSKVKEILNNYPDYPLAESREYGEVFVSVEGESTETVYNVPNSLMTVFPGEDHGLHSDKETLSVLTNTRNNIQIEGGNELVFQHLQAARIGMLDLEAFKRAIKYNLLPNGTATLNTLQINGRYTDHGDPYFMSGMGIWFENFSLPVVINECLMQSYTGTVRLFPNWTNNQSAEFKTLRAAGGFLISSSIIDGEIQNTTIESENDNKLKLYNPWGSKSKIKVISADGSTKNIGGDVVAIPMKKGEVITLEEVKPMRVQD